MQPGPDDPYQQQPFFPAGQTPYPGQPPYPGPTPGGAPQNTQGLISMILGILSIPLLCCFFLGIPLGIAAAVLGFLGLNKTKAGLATNRGQALTGLICGGVAVVLGLVALLYVLIQGNWHLSTYNDFS